MSGPVKPNPVPEWLRPENASVLDSPVEKAIKALASILGADDPQSQVMGLLNPTETGATTLEKIAGAIAGKAKRATDMGFDVGERWYHGTNRLDRVADAKGFKASRATSGPSAYLTNDPEIAGKYAVGKPDTSLTYDGPQTTSEWFMMPVAGSRKGVDIDRAWYHLSPEQRAQVSDALSRIGHDDEGRIFVGASADAGPGGASHWAHTLKEHRGNALAAARDIWVDSGAIFGDEEKFIDILRMAGLPDVRYNSPDIQRPGIVPVVAKKGNVLNTQEIPPDVLQALDERARRSRIKPQAYGADPWDKNTRDPREWMQQLRTDYAKGENSFVWTSVPDWVVETLKQRGYDSILDTGGKMGGDAHKVLIPFSGSQMRVPWAKFDPRRANSSDLMASYGPIGMALMLLGQQTQPLQVQGPQ